MEVRGPDCPAYSRSHEPEITHAYRELPEWRARCFGLDAPPASTAHTKLWPKTRNEKLELNFRDVGVQPQSLSPRPLNPHLKILDSAVLRAPHPLRRPSAPLIFVRSE